METQTVAESFIAPELVEYANTLIEEGYRVFYYRTRRWAKEVVTWLIIERDGNAGTVELGQYRHLDPGVNVSFMTKPSREYGSGLSVWHHDYPDYRAPGAETFLDAARIATGDTFSNFANPGHPLPNHGMAHFDWAKDSLIQLVREAE